MEGPRAGGAGLVRHPPRLDRVPSLSMPARKPRVEVDDLDRLGQLVQQMTPAQLADYEKFLSPGERAIVERAMALVIGEGWRASPLSMGVRFGKLDALPHSELLSRKFVDAFEGRSPRQLWALPPQHGKGAWIGTPVLTPYGWTTMGDLRVGHRVVGGDGLPCTVTGVSEVRHLDCYRVTLVDGATVVVDADHRWRVWDKHGHDAAAWRASRQKGTWRVLSTREMLGAHALRYRLPVRPMIELPERPVPIHPYALGVWLGDGSSNGPDLTCADDGILDVLAEVGEPARRRPSGGPYHCTWAGTRTAHSTFLLRLRALGVLDNKHVPDAYVHGSAKQRLQLLQGLMDTDGCCVRSTSGYTQCEFTSTSRRLAENTLLVVRSLGIRATLKEGRATLDGRDIGPKYRVQFTTDQPVFRLARKLDRLYDVPGPRKAAARFGFTITPTATVPTCCITVDSPDGTFLLGESLIVTHNTLLASRWGPAWALDADPTINLALASYGDFLARENATAVRDILVEHGDVLRGRLRRDRRRADRFVTEEGGGLISAGIGSALSGFSAHGVVIDDPFKNWQEAHSDARRKLVWNWFRSVARTRLNNRHGVPGFVIVCATRWHEEDLTGMLLAQDATYEGEGWELIRLPAIAEADDPLGRKMGEPLAPALHPLEELNALMLSAGSYLSAGLFQQRPAPEEGGEIKREWWRWDSTLPTRWDAACTSFDCKLKDKEGGDFVVGQAWVRTGSDFWCIDQLRGQWNLVTTKTAVALLAVRHPEITTHVIENAGNGPEVMEELRRAQPGYVVSEDVRSQLGITDAELPLVNRMFQRGIPGLMAQNVKFDKMVRMRAQLGLIEAGNVHLPEGKDWAVALVNEAAAFGSSSSAHDDMIDAMSQALKRLRQAEGVVIPPSSRQVGKPKPSARSRATIGRPRPRYG